VDGPACAATPLILHSALLQYLRWHDANELGGGTSRRRHRLEQHEAPARRPHSKRAPSPGKTRSRRRPAAQPIVIDPAPDAVTMTACHLRGPPANLAARETPPGQSSKSI